MKAVYQYFDELVMPMIRKCHPGLADDMSILVLGSAGLGIADEWSDLEAAVYLPEKLWREQGASLQLSLNRLVSEQNVWKKEGSVLCVHPLNWLLDGQGAKIAELPASPG
ncbi:MAG: hypothetical protein K2N94_09735, partial [Lachnospiraceae bacterium]|nr:hypothetical protein [Lachnospiraceae bacterium]